MEEHTRSFDVCVVCALAEEARAFLEVVRQQGEGAIEERSSPRYQYSYRLARIKNDQDESLTLHVSWLPRYGPQEMTLHLSHVLEECQPRIAIMTGICAGDAQRVRLGDLVVAERIFTYDNGKLTRDEHGRSVHENDTLTYQLDAAILQFLGLFDAWKPLVARLKRPASPPDQHTRHKIACHIKPMASGSAVRADQPFEEVRAPVRGTLAIDMEGAAFGLVMSRHPLIPWLVVKGVCDYADRAKNDAYHDYAARASALYALRFIRAYVTNARLAPFPEQGRRALQLRASHPESSDTLGKERKDIESQPKGTIPHYQPPFDEELLIPPEHFIGREEDVQWLRAHLLAGGATSISAIRGMGGIGKTALAAVTIRQIRAENRFRDGIAVVLCLYQTDSDEIVRRVLARFDSQRRQPETNNLSELIDVAHRLLDKKDVLVVLDNVEPELKVERVLIPLRAASATVLLTARHMLPQTIVPPEKSRRLDLLSLLEAMDLFAQSLGRQTLLDLSPTEYAAAERIVAALDRHTFAVKVIGAYVHGSGRNLEELSQELEDPQQALELSPDDNIPGDEIPRTLVQVFARSFDALSHDAQQLFTALAAFATAEFSRRATLALGKALGLADPREATDLLVRRALVETSVNHNIPEQGDRERRSLHPLTRAFTIHKFKLWSQERQAAIHHALASFYAIYAGSLTGISERALAFDELNINGELKWVLEHRENGLVIQLCKGMQNFWRNGGRRDASDTYLPKGIMAAETIHDLLAKAELAYTHGQALFQTGRPDEAASFYQMSLGIHREMKNNMQEGIILCAFGRLSLSVGHMEEAERYCQQALDIHQEIKEQETKEQRIKAQQEEGVDLSSLAQIAIDCGQLEKAERYLQQASPTRQRGRGRRIDCIEYGRIAIARKNLDKAEKYFQEALDISQNKTGKEKEMDRRGEAASFNWLGQVALDRGQWEEGKKLLKKALEIHQEVQDREGEAVALFRLAHLAEIQDDLESAEQQYQASLNIFRAAQLGRYIPNTLLEFGRFLIEWRSKPEKGCSMLLDAERLYKHMGIHTAELDHLPSEQKAREIAQRLGRSWQEFTSSEGNYGE